MSGEPVLTIDNLHVEFRQGGNVTHAVRGISFDINEKETVALVGESGSGSLASAMAIITRCRCPPES